MRLKVPHLTYPLRPRGRRGIRRFIAALVLSLVASSALAEPALWVAKQGNATVYLFGTIHVLKSDIEWWTPKISAAFDGSQELWLETEDLDSTSMRPLVAQLGFDEGHSLASEVAPSDLARLDAAAKSAGYPGEGSLDHLRPWLAAMSLETSLIVKAGYDRKRGVEVLLKDRASLTGKFVRGLETAEQQIHFFANLPQARQIELLRSVLDDAALAPEVLDAAAHRWAEGDVEAFRKGTNEFTEHNHPDLYAVFLVNRNRAWAERISDWMGFGRGPVFIAVGAGHMAGPDSLLKALEARGVTITRM